MNADTNYGTHAAPEIRAVVAVLVPAEDAEYLVKMIDYIEASNKRQGGAPLSARLHRVRAQLAAGVQAVLGSHRCDDNADMAPEVSESDSDALLDTTTAAAMLGLKRTTVLLHCRNGRLGQKLGREWVIRRDELEQFQRERLERKGEVA
jgi:Helix-turn-helix domain